MLGRVLGLWFSAGAACLFAAQPAWSDEQIEYGEYLSSQCSTCPRLDAFEGGIPPLGHLPRDYFIIAMKEYKSGRRLNPAMVSVANSLSQEEIEALAAYYAALRQRQ